MSAIKKEVIIGDCRLLLGDCLEVMLELNRFDVVITDPPYGIGEDGGKFRGRKGQNIKVQAKKSWDSNIPPRKAFDLIRSLSDHQIIWGGNYFTEYLPATKSWLYWQKLMGGDFADGELAWTSRGRALREFTCCPKGKGGKHPTQKPVPVMDWCLGFFPESKNILDPFMGSGTTGVSCVKLARSFTGIELDPDYFEIACERIQKAYDAPDMFVEAEKQPEPKQEALL